MSLAGEMARIVRLALPVAAAQLLIATAGLVDTLMAGAAGVSDLAGVSLGSAIWITLTVLPMGLLMAINPVVGQYVGAKRYHAITNFMHQALRISLLLALLLFVLIRLHPVYLPRLIGDADVLVVSGGYLDRISWGVPALIGIFLLRPYSEGLGLTLPFMIASLVSLLVNIPANYMLIFGHWGAPELGGAGAGLATAIALWSAFFVTLWYSNRHAAYTLATVWHRLSPWDADEVKHLFRVGLPLSLTLFVEVSVFSLIALFLGGRPAEEIAANQIAFNVAYLVFTLPLSVSVAATIRVGTEVGAQRFEAAKRAALAALLLGLLAALFNITLLLGFAPEIARLYTDNATVADLATRLLYLAALYQLADAFVVPTQGALRGYKDTGIPMLLAIFAYWVITLPLGYLLGLSDLLGIPRGAEGFWIALVIGLGISAVLMSFRLWRLSHRRTNTEFADTTIQRVVA